MIRIEPLRGYGDSTTYPWVSPFAYPSDHFGDPGVSMALVKARAFLTLHHLFLFDQFNNYRIWPLDHRGLSI